MLFAGAFGAGFLMRPLGAIVLGAYIDRGRPPQGLIVTPRHHGRGRRLIAFGRATRRSACSRRPWCSWAGCCRASRPVPNWGRLRLSVGDGDARSPRLLHGWQSASQQVAIVLAAVLGFTLEELLPSNAGRLGLARAVLRRLPDRAVLFVLRRSLQETEAFPARHAPPTTSARSAARCGRTGASCCRHAAGAMTTVFFYLITAYTPTFGRRCCT